jgi:hypothetical protein
MFLAIIAGVLIFFFPIATYLSDTSYLKFFLHMIKELSSEPFNDMSVENMKFEQWFTLPLSGGQTVIVILIFISIFRYKKRITQIRLNNLSIFLNVLLVGGIFYYTTMLEEMTGAASQYGIGAVFPLISIILLFLANYYIRKDEKLIRSTYRLR